jgi:hypothetical protein
MRKQYIALVAVFLLMMTFNLTATHRASRIAADMARHAEQQMRAETVVHEFNLVTNELNQLKTRANLMKGIDTRFDVAAILAELSHIVDESVVLSKIDLLAEPFAKAKDDVASRSGIVRAARGAGTQVQMPLGDAKLRVVVAGVAIHQMHVADLVCKLDESSYFQQVRLSYSRPQTLTDSTRAAKPRDRMTDGTAAEPLEATAFEITCYLANYVKTEEQ